MRDDSKQRKGNEPGPEKNKRETEKLLNELNLLKSIKAVADTEDGMIFIKWVLGLKNIFDDVFTNSGFTAYNLGIQHIGKQIVTKLIDAGCELKITDLGITKSNAINDINIRLNQLMEEKNKCQKK